MLSYMFQQIRALKLHDPRSPGRCARCRASVPGGRPPVTVSTGDLPKAHRYDSRPRFLRAELQWLAGAVGQARDTEVIRARLKDMICAEPPELLIGPVAQQIEEHLGAIQQQGRAAGLAALDSDRLLPSPRFPRCLPSRTSAQRPSRRRKRWGRSAGSSRRNENASRQRSGPSTAARDGTPQDAALHEVRKSAKRLRYAAEAASPISANKQLPLPGPRRASRRSSETSRTASSPGKPC